MDTWVEAPKGRKSVIYLLTVFFNFSNLFMIFMQLIFLIHHTQQILESDWMYVCVCVCVWEREREDAWVCARPVLPDAPIVIVGAAAWFIINLFIILLVQIGNKMGSQKKF
jgi:hypothetical protein